MIDFKIFSYSKDLIIVFEMEESASNSTQVWIDLNRTSLALIALENDHDS